MVGYVEKCNGNRKAKQNKTKVPYKWTANVWIVNAAMCWIEENCAIPMQYAVVTARQVVPKSVVTLDV